MRRRLHNFQKLERDKMVIEAKSRGFSTQELAKEFGLSTNHIGRITRDHKSLTDYDPYVNICYCGEGRTLATNSGRTRK